MNLRAEGCVKENNSYLKREGTILIEPVNVEHSKELEITWYPFHSGFGVGVPWVGGKITGTNGELSVNALGEDHDEMDDEDVNCDGKDPPLSYPEVEPAPNTAVGSGWWNLQFDPYLQDPVRM